MTHSFSRRLTRRSGSSALLLGALLGTDAAAQSITVNPDSLAFSGRMGGPNPATQTVSIAGTGTPTPSWRITGVTASWLTVSPQRGSAPAKLTFAVNLAGLRAGAYQDTVDVASTAPSTPPKTVVVILWVAGAAAPPPPAPPAGQPAPRLPPGAQWGEYQVAFVFIGYTGQVDGYPNCAVKTAGTDSLIGIVSGAEPSDPDEDVEYTGTLARATTMDICETKGRNRPDDIDDEQVWCVASLTGTSRMNVKVTVSSAAGDGGAYLKATADTGASTSQVTGNCAQSTMAIYRTDTPAGRAEAGESPTARPSPMPSAPCDSWRAG